MHGVEPTYLGGGQGARGRPRGRAPLAPSTWPPTKAGRLAGQATMYVGFHTMYVGSPPCMGSPPCIKYQVPVSRYPGIQVSIILDPFF